MQSFAKINPRENFQIYRIHSSLCATDKLRFLPTWLRVDTKISSATLFMSIMLTFYKVSFFSLHILQLFSFVSFYKTMCFKTLFGLRIDLS